MEIITKESAIMLGLSKYYTGVPCVHGHLSERRTKGGVCIECRQSKQREYSQKQYAKNKEKIKARASEYAKENKQKIIEYQISYREKNKEHLKKYHQEYYIKNKKSLRQSNKEYRSRRDVKDNQNKRRFNQYRNDIEYKVSSIIRGMVHRIARATENNKIGKTLEILGYSASEFKTRIEQNFKDGMSWENYGEWHIDHIKPISLFIKKGETRPCVINSLSNLQPLWANENLSKGNKYIE